MKRSLKIAGIVIAVLLVVIIALPFLVNVNSFRPRLESELSTALGRDVKVGNLSLSILSGSVAADNLSIADDPAFSSNPFIQAKQLKVGVELIPLIFSKALHVTHLTLDQPQIMLLRSASGKWNFSSLGAQSNGQPTNAQPANAKPATNQQSTSTESNPNLSVAKLNVNDGRLTLGRSGSSAKPNVYDHVDITVTDFSFTSQFPFTLAANLPGGGKLKLDGKAGPINQADASLTPLDAKLQVKDLDLAQSGFVDPSSGIAGIADFDGNVSSDGKMVHTTGTVKANKLKLAQKGSPAATPVDVKYSVDHDLQAQAGTVRECDVSMGKALAQLTGTYHVQGDSTVLNMKLNGQSMPVDDLEAMLPALGVILPSGSSLKGGTFTTDLGLSGPADKLVITGPVRLSDSRLAGFNLGSKLSAVSALSGSQNTGSDTSIKNFSSNVRVAPDGTKTDDVNLQVPAVGEIVGTGTISPGGALDYHLNAKLTGGAVTGVSQMAGLGGKGGAIPFMIQGTTSDPKFVPDVKGMVGSQLQDQLKSRLGGAKGTGNPAADALSGLFGKKKKNK
jgi:AsmA protein